MPHPSGLRIVAIHNASRGATGADDEWVQIVNDGTERWERHEWQLHMEGVPDRRRSAFRFPLAIPNGGWWSFDPGESIYVFTGNGVDRYIAHPPDGRRPQFHLYWDLETPQWTAPGGVACLRDSRGTLVADPFPVP